MLLTLCACGGTAEPSDTAPEEPAKTETVTPEPEPEAEPEPVYPGQPITLENARMDISISFVLPDTEYDWTIGDDSSGFGSNCFSGTSYMPAEAVEDPAKDWYVVCTLSVLSAENANYVLTRELQEDEQRPEDKDGRVWIRKDDAAYNEIRCTTLLGDYVDGQRQFIFRVIPRGRLDEGRTPDLAMRDAIAESIFRSFRCTEDFAGKRDLSDGVYSGNLTARWPAEIPFEDGVIRAERTVAANNALTVRFTYEDPVRESMIYTVTMDDISTYVMSKSRPETCLERYYFGEDPIYKDAEYVEGTVAGHNAAVGTEYRSGKNGTTHSVVVEFSAEGSEKYPYINFKSGSKLDRQKAAAAKEKGLTDFSWLTDSFDTGADEYSMAKADEVLEAVVAAMEFVP